MDEQAFLKAAGWQDATGEAIKGDCSTREFTRLRRKETQTAILMQAAPDQKTQAYLKIAALLRQAGLRAPEIYAAEETAQGALVLMEDFGGVLFSDRIEAGEESAPLDACIVESLVRLHQAIHPAMLEGLGLTDFTSALFADQACWCLDHYAAARAGDALDEQAREAFRAAWLTVLKPVDALPRVLILRDFILDNVLDLGGTGAGRVGFIDFQDGGPGPLPYDLASYCEEVRRDSGAARWARVMDAYVALNPVISRATLEDSGRILSAQRHVRLLGNRALQQKRNILTRLEAHVKNFLQDEALQPVRAWFVERGLLRG